MDSKPVTNPAAATRGSRRTNRAADATYTRPGLDMDRISFTVLATTAADTVTTATAVIPHDPGDLLGCIGAPFSATFCRRGRGNEPGPGPGRAETASTKPAPDRT